MHIPPTVWGPFFWMTIHITALGYPSKPTYTEKRSAKQFFESLANLIPCPVCREHYKQHITKNPILPHLDNRSDLFKWTVELHNAVNEKLNKPKWTVQESLDYIKQLGERERSPIITSKDFSEQNLQSLVKGVAMGVAATAAVGGIFYWLRTSRLSD
jgi:hypothetical protein